MFQFSCRFAFLNQFFILQTGHRKYAVSSRRSNFDAVRQRRQNFDQKSVWM